MKKKSWIIYLLIGLIGGYFLYKKKDELFKCCKEEFCNDEYDDHEE